MWDLQMKQYVLILMIQIVGYVLSGDPAYVPRYNNARNQIRKYERDEIVEELVRYYLKGQGIDL